MEMKEQLVVGKEHQCWEDRIVVEVEGGEGLRAPLHWLPPEGPKVIRIKSNYQVIVVCHTWRCNNVLTANGTPRMSDATQKVVSPYWWSSSLNFKKSLCVWFSNTIPSKEQLTSQLVADARSTVAGVAFAVTAEQGSQSGEPQVVRRKSNFVSHSFTSRTQKWRCFNKFCSK